MYHLGLKGGQCPPTLCDPLPLSRTGCGTWGFSHNGSTKKGCRDKSGGRKGNWEWKKGIKKRNQEDGDRRREAKMGREVERSAWWAKEPAKCTRPRARLKMKLRKQGSENGKAEQERPQGHSVPAGHLWASHEGALCRSLTSLPSVFVPSQGLLNTWHMTLLPKPNKMGQLTLIFLSLLFFLKHRLFANRHKLLCILRAKHTTPQLVYPIVVSFERSSWHRQSCFQSSHVIRLSSTQDAFSWR